MPVRTEALLIKLVSACIINQTIQYCLHSSDRLVQGYYFVFRYIYLLLFVLALFDLGKGAGSCISC